jgi:hypothetical protein
MNPETYNPLDTSLKGDVEYVLRDPRVKVLSAAPTNSIFDKSFGGRQKSWAFPAGTGDVDAFQFPKNADGSFKLGADGLPILAGYFIAGDIAPIFNLQSNPTADGFVAKDMPMPMRALTAAEKFVLIRDRAGIIQVDRWFIRDGEPTVPPPSRAAGSFTDADRADLKSIKMLVSKILAGQ